MELHNPMPRVFLSDKLGPGGIELLKNSGLEIDLRPGLKDQALRDAMQAADGMVVRSETKVTAELLENPGKLRAIVRAGVGVDNIDVAAATRKGHHCDEHAGRQYRQHRRAHDHHDDGSGQAYSRRRSKHARQEMGTPQVRRRPARRQDAGRCRPWTYRP